jgi:hypothetical protein
MPDAEEQYEVEANTREAQKYPDTEDLEAIDRKASVVRPDGAVIGPREKPGAENRGQQPRTEVNLSQWPGYRKTGAGQHRETKRNDVPNYEPTPNLPEFDLYQVFHHDSCMLGEAWLISV